MKMKNKKAEQDALRQRHKEALKANRRKEALLERKEPSINEKPSILIYCEGKNTEPSYFNQFRLPSLDIKSFGEGKNTLSLVKRAIQLSEEKAYDQIWCVFDADPKPDNPNQAKNFNRAIELANKNKFGIAYSNQAFEYWIILHFDDHQGGKMDRKLYDEKINHLLEPYKLTYEGKDCKIITEAIFEILTGVDEKTKKERTILAIDRAKRNYELFDHSNPAAEESSTTVFRLVDELLKFL
jgi:hypothetical protein